MAENVSSPATRSDPSFVAGVRILFGTRFGFGVLLVAGLLFLLPCLSYSGFCFSQSRFLSDEEFIDAAIDDVLRAPLHAVESPSGGYMRFSPEKQIEYANRAEFRRLNPDCCKIVDHDRAWVGYGHQLFGQAARSVRIRYNVTYINEFGTVSKMEAVARRAIGNCGYVLNTGH